ncbi:MAG: ChaN family lipoprotein [Sandaracinaceae bacterium]
MNSPPPAKTQSAHPSRRRNRFFRSLLRALVALLVAGCGAPVRHSGDRTEGRFVDGQTGRTITREAASARLMEARLVYVGERHDRPEDHAVQAHLATLAGADGAPLALGFEMVSRPFQPVLDAYQEEHDEPALIRGTEWDTRWGFDFAMYRPLLQLGMREHVHLYALNAPREQTRAIAREGLEALEAAERAGLPELDLEDPAHRAMIAAAFEGHPHMDPARLERFYAAQVVWDETMAETVAQVMSASTDVRMLVFAGVMHIQPSAIPARAARRGAPEHRVLMPIREAELADALEAHSADVLFVTAE